MLTTPEEFRACSRSSSLCARHTHAHIQRVSLLLHVQPLNPSPKCAKSFSQKKNPSHREFVLTHKHTQHLICGTGAAYVIFFFLRITTQNSFDKFSLGSMDLLHKNKPIVSLFYLQAKETLSASRSSHKASQFPSLVNSEFAGWLQHSC